jgi:hypothetical protein
MARYRILDRTFIHGSLRERGEIVEYDGKAGSTLEPLDPPEPPEDEEPADGGEVAIPADWREHKPKKRIALAKRLGAPASTNTESADEMIAAEEARRAAA